MNLSNRERRLLFDINGEFLELSLLGKAWGWIKFVFKLLFIYGILAVFFSTPKVFSGSMTPTLETNDFVLVSSCSYRFKLPFTDIVLFQVSKPQRGDVIAFTAMNHYSKNSDDPSKKMIFTKRIVACPGDTIQVRGGIIFINDKPVDFKFNRHYSYIENKKTHHGYMYDEQFPNEKRPHSVLYYDLPNSSPVDNTEKFTLKDKEYFCMGDNRHDSADSRYLIGIIHENNIQGKAIITLISNGNISSLNLKDLLTGLKWHRFCTWIY